MNQKEARERVHIGDNAQVDEVYGGGKRQINTLGGVYIEGNVETGGGNFAGGHQTNIGSIIGSTGFIIGDQWRPKTGGCRVLITSRRGEWDVARAIHQVRLDTFTPAESVRLLTHLAPHLTTEEKRAIAEALGHFPLALHLAGSFLKRYKRVKVDEYLAEIEQKTLRHISLGTLACRRRARQHLLAHPT